MQRYSGKNSKIQKQEINDNMMMIELLYGSILKSSFLRLAVQKIELSFFQLNIYIPILLCGHSRRSCSLSDL